MALGVWMHRRETRKANEALRQVAERVGGRLVDDTWSRRGRIRLTVGGVEGEVVTEPSTDDTPGATQIHFQWTAPGTLRLGPEGVLSRIGKLFGYRDIQVGDYEFDRTFLIRGEPEDWVQAALDRGARAALTTITALSADDPVRVEAGAAGLRVRCPRDRTDKPELLVLIVENAVAVLGRFQDASSGRASLPAVRDLLAAGKCPVCGQALAPPLSHCSRCRTPHHRDCWEYFGRCAIYGCDARRPLPLPGKGKA